MVAAAFEAYNLRDLDKAMTYYVDDGLSYLMGGQIIKDKGALKTNFEAGVGTGETVEVEGCVPKGNGAACSIIARNAACYKAQCGLDAYHATVDVVVKNGMIQSEWFTTSPEDTKACRNNYMKFDGWARDNRSDEYRALTATGKDAVQGRALGEGWTRLCQAYLDSLGQAAGPGEASPKILLVANQ